MASTKSEQPNPDSVVGRTYADLGHAFLQTLGKLGPSAIIVGGFLFAFYMYNQQLSEAQLKADQQNQAKLDAAQQALVATYQSIAGLSEKQIANVQHMLDLHGKVTTETETARAGSATAKAEADLARAEALRAKAEAETATNEAQKAKDEAQDLIEQMAAATQVAEAARLKADEADMRLEQTELLRSVAAQNLEKLEIERSRIEEERDRAQAELDRRRELLTLRTQEIEKLREQLEELATQVTQKAATGGALDEEVQLAQRILGQDAFQTPRNLLQAAADARTGAAFESLKALSGLRADILRPLLEEGVGFKGWVFYDASDQEDVFFGFLDTGQSEYQFPVIFSIDEGRVYDVTVGQSCLL